MARITCPTCGYTEDDARPHDRTTYYELCVLCAPPARKTPGRVFACSAANIHGNPSGTSEARGER